MLCPRVLLLTSASLLAIWSDVLALASARPRAAPVAPKIMIVSMWTPEAQVWHARVPATGLGNLTARAITTPGLSMLYPFVFCTPDHAICQVTLGEGEINAAASMTALVLSRRFDLSSTYFLLAGIAGVNPRRGTLGSVALALYAVQVGLQYEMDARDIPDGFATGYIPYGRAHPLEYPLVSYGTEVFELSAALRDAAWAMAQRADLGDSDGARRYRARYEAWGDEFGAATAGPALVRCDVATSDVYYSGRRLAEAFETTSSVWTNGSSEYCMTAQEENASLEALLRGAIEGLVDFGRILVIRAASNFDRAPPNVSEWHHLTQYEQDAFALSLDNLFLSGVEIVRGILDDWNCTYAAGLTPRNYVGDIFGSLGGQPDFGYGSITGGGRVAPAGGSGQLLSRRAVSADECPMRKH